MVFPKKNNSHNIAILIVVLGATFMVSSCELFRTIFLGPLYELTIDKENGGIVTMIPEAERSEDGIYFFREGTEVTLTPTADEGYRFIGWETGEGRDYSASLVLPLIENDITVTAEFSPVETAWTILVYLDGDNDLESSAIEDFEEMEQGLSLARGGDPDVMDKIAVLAQFDRGRWSAAEFDGIWETTRRYEIMPDYTAGCGSRLIEDLGEANMGDADTLKRFIEWGKAEFPAEKYALILWNHGGGARNLSSEVHSRDICVDDTDGNDILYVGEITDELTGSHSVDLLGMDACLMGTIEVAYEYRLKTEGFGADYLVASPASEQGDGWEYDRIFNRLGGADIGYDAAVLSAENFARLLVKEYRDAFQDYYFGDQTMSAFDMSQVATVKEKIDALASELSGSKTKVEAVRDDAVFFYDPSYANDSVIWPYYELGSLCDVLAAADISAIVTSATAELKTALQGFILSAWADVEAGDYDETSGGGYRGVSIFFSRGENQGAGWNDYSLYQQWYTSDDMSSTEYPYGKLDFCDYDGLPVTTWKDLFDSWYL